MVKAKLKPNLEWKTPMARW